MAGKSTESLVRELLELVTTLNKKVSTLELKIDDQNALLMGQSRTIKTLTELCTRNSDISDAKTPALDQAAVSRPLRSAREKAAAAISATSLTRSVTNKIIEGRTKSTLTYSEVSAAKTPEPNRSAASSANTNKQPVRNATKRVATKPEITSEERCATPLDREADEQWKTVRRNTRKRTNNKITIGVGTEDAELQAVENIKYIQAWSFTPNTTSEMIQKFLNKIQPCDQYFVEKRILKTDRHAAFVIGIPESIFSMFNSPTVWPRRVRFSDWFLRQPREGRGNDVTD